MLKPLSKNGKLLHRSTLTSVYKSLSQYLWKEQLVYIGMDLWLCVGLYVMKPDKTRDRKTKWQACSFIVCRLYLHTVCYSEDCQQVHNGSREVKGFRYQLYQYTVSSLCLNRFITAVARHKGIAACHIILQLDLFIATSSYLQLRGKIV